MSKSTLTSPVSILSGVGKTRTELLNKLGIFTVHDLLFYAPRTYENRGDIRLLGAFDNEFPHSYILTVATSVSNAKLKRNMTISKFRAFDESGS
jgi:ATP-dependent DNA helicase RecG